MHNILFNQHSVSPLALTVPSDRDHLFVSRGFSLANLAQLTPIELLVDLAQFQQRVPPHLLLTLLATHPNPQFQQLACQALCSTPSPVAQALLLSSSVPSMAHGASRFGNWMAPLTLGQSVLTHPFATSGFTGLRIGGSQIGGLGAFGGIQNSPWMGNWGGVSAFQGATNLLRNPLASCGTFPASMGTIMGSSPLASSSLGMMTPYSATGAAGLASPLVLAGLVGGLHQTHPVWNAITLLRSPRATDYIVSCLNRGCSIMPHQLVQAVSQDRVLDWEISRILEEIIVLLHQVGLTSGQTMTHPSLALGGLGNTYPMAFSGFSGLWSRW